MSCCGFFGTFCVFVVLVQFCCSVLRWLYRDYIGPRFGQPIEFKSYGKWALVTGATDGIGKEYAKQLAQRGMNIILVSRTLTKLQAVAKKIEETFNVETAVIDVDFTSGPEIFDKIKDRVKGKEIGVLVNNVGMCYSAPEFFLDIPGREKFIQDIIKCNITSMPMMCSIILPQMVERKKGVIINISSVSAVVPCTRLCVYSASKAFADKFSSDLAAEYEHQGIIIQSVLPGPVATNMTKIKTGSFMVPTPKNYVKSALKAVGFAEFTAGYWSHSALQFASQFVYFLMPSFYRIIEFQVFNFVRNREIKSGRYVPVKNTN